MKATTFLIFIFASLVVFPQSKPETTEKFNIEGLVKHQVVVSLPSLSSYKSYAIDSIVIRNHLLERKYSMNRIRGVLLKDILDKAEIDAPTPKLLSEYYVVCIASDNYKVVFSWNEIFNSKNGDDIYILTEHDGKPASAADDRIALISGSDTATGRRYVKWLNKIIVERVR